MPSDFPGLESGVDRNYGAPVFRQIQAPAATNDFIAIGTVSYLYQEFYLPSNYERGSGTPEARIPPLSGFQLFVGVTNSSTAVLEYKLERQEPSTGDWTTEVTGSTTGCHAQGTEVWFDVYFDRLLTVLDEWITDQHRFRLLLRSPTGISNIWYSVPNPLVTSANARATTNGTVPVQDVARDVSFLFTILAAVGEEGTDWLGNAYRHSLSRSSVDNTSTLDSTTRDKYWLSKPNPSRFAVESLYFDVSNEGRAQVIDRVLLDPLTPDVYFTVYYSNEGNPETEIVDWENKLWTRIPQSFRMRRRETHAFLAPITAKYVKLEFTQLQAKPYSPGGVQKPIHYKKYPKWVLDYFLLRTLTDADAEDPFTARRVQVEYDALDIAYNYYLDDLDQAPATPVQLGFKADSGLNAFLRSRNDNSDQIDAQTLNKISTTFQGFRNDPVLRGKGDFLLTLPLISLSAADPSESTLELTDPASNLNNVVSTVNREAIIFEQTMPVMFFWLDCRHTYREVEATFKYDKAYFAGVREIAFTREHYTAASDTALYIESAGDHVNVERNDFVVVDFGWQTYGES